MLEHALTLVAPDSIDAARLLANHAFLLHLNGEHAAGDAELERALAIARKIGDDQLTAALLLQSTGQAATQLDVPRALRAHAGHCRRRGSRPRHRRAGRRTRGVRQYRDDLRGGY
jgi:hypothetical protein